MTSARAVIPPFRVEFTDDERAEILEAFDQVLRSGRLILGPFTEQFEARIAELTATRYAIAVNSGTSALEVVFRALGITGGRVLVPTNTNFATAAAAIYAGAAVEFYDGGLYPDLDDIQARLSKHTAAVVVVHIGGYLSPELSQLVVLCEQAGLPLVEDAAHAHGASLHGRPAGSFGHAAAFSFFPTKVVTTGEGGMVTTNDATLAGRVRQYRDQGKSPDGSLHELWGNSWRITELGAAMGLVQVRRLDRDAAHRRDLLSRYQAALGGVGGLAFPTSSDGMKPSGYKSIALLPDHVDRASFKTWLRERRVVLGKEVYETPLHRQPVFAGAGSRGTYPDAERFCAGHICLPVWRYLGAQQVEEVIDLVTEQLHLSRGVS